MKRLIVTYSITTPMFLGDANQQCTGFRVPSFKGALRFWWHALVWTAIRNNHDGNLGEALSELHRREGNLFGQAAGRDTSNQSRVLLSAESCSLGSSIAGRSLTASHHNSDQTDGISYLAGQGLRSRTGVKDGTVQIEVVLRAGTSTKLRKSVERALMIVGLLGGLGSRARRGFGSLVLDEIKGDRLLNIEVPRDIAALRTALSSLIGDRTDQRPPFSAFSSQSRIELSTTASSAQLVHAGVGAAMRRFREDLKEDNTLARQAADGERPIQPPERSTFGLPLQFYFKNDEAKVLVEPNTTKEQKMDRRGSPLLIHIHAFPNEDGPRRYGAIQTFLPAQFLPPRIGIRVKWAKGSRFTYPDFVPADDPILRYLDAFPQRREVLS